jgi:hypothetical protein
MPLSPEDLLIFKARAGTKEVKETKPVAVEQARPQPQPSPVEQTPPKPQQAPAAETTVQPAAAQAQPAAAAEQAERRRSLEAVAAAEEEKLNGPAANKKGPLESGVEGAKQQFCAWHAWRPAYAVCNYCHRPFCYEDVEELNNEYYCLEDIDKVSSHVEGVYTKYSNLSFVSAAMLMLSFAVFILFANAQIAYVVNAIRTLGAPAFISTINFSYETLFLEAGLTFISLVAAIMIVMQDKRAFMIGIVACIGDIALFSYLFLGSGTLYIAIIAAISFVGLISLAYSRVTYSSYTSEVPFADLNQLAAAEAQKTG